MHLSTAIARPWLFVLFVGLFMLAAVIELPQPLLLSVVIVAAVFGAAVLGVVWQGPWIRNTLNPLVERHPGRAFALVAFIFVLGLSAHGTPAGLGMAVVAGLLSGGALAFD